MSQLYLIVSMIYKETSLWKSAFESSALCSATVSKALSQLIAAYDKFFERASMLANQISSDLPELTVHDENHFNALWEVADLIVGPRHDLNPLEIFVLGSAILLHDTANTVQAFKAGRAEVENTPQWRDNEAKLLNNRNNEGEELTAEEQKLVLLFTLRDIHAQRAKELHTFSVSVDDDKLFLIDDSDLRHSVGELIGEIAASHHWDVDDLNSKLQHVIGPPAGFPSDWSIRPILLACLLRCADAAQIDASRAPRFLQGIIQPNPVSEEHWNAQNMLHQPSISAKNPETLVFTSTKRFPVVQSKAWWVAFDLIVNADKELNACDALLRDLNFPTFQVRRIAGAETPRRLSQFVRTEGWEPVDAQIKVSNVSRVVDLFGGEKLYGNSVHIPLRELLQNASDAIKIRRALDTGDDPFEGKITVRLRKVENHIYLEVDDDGFGMSEEALIGPLLDFTSSYLNSSIAAREYPGLVGRRIKRRGKYGVGFFSVFMLSNQVMVTSRSFDKSPEIAKTLRFDNGLTTRPLLMEATPEGYGIKTSTRVSIRITAEQVEKLKTIAIHGVSGDLTNITLPNIIASMAPLLDVDIYVDEFGDSSLAHKANWASQDAEEWLNEVNPDIINLNEAQTRYLKTALDKVRSNLEFIDPKEPQLGKALIAYFAGRGTYSVDGLTTPKYVSGAANEICGVINKSPNGPQRNGGHFPNNKSIAEWATRQAYKLSKCNLSNAEKYIAAYRTAKFGGVPYPIATAFLNGEAKPIDDFYQVLLTGFLYAPIERASRFKERSKLASIRYRVGSTLYGFRRDDLTYNVSVLEGRDNVEADYYNLVPSETEAEAGAFFSMLASHVSKNGRELVMESIEDFEIAEYTGPSSAFESFTKGMQIKMTVLKISLVEAQKNKQTPP